MRWRAADANTIRSDAGYAVMRCTANGVPLDPLRFVAFRMLGDKRLVLGGYDSADDARAACEAHHSQVEAA